MELLDRRFQRLAVNEAHDVARLAIRALDHTVNRHDAGMFELGGNLGFQLEAPACIRLCRTLRLDALEGDVAVELLIAAQKDFAEAAMFPGAEGGDVAEPGQWCP